MFITMLFTTIMLLLNLRVHTKRSTRLIRIGRLAGQGLNAFWPSTSRKHSGVADFGMILIQMLSLTAAQSSEYEKC